MTKSYLIRNHLAITLIVVVVIREENRVLLNNESNTMWWRDCSFLLVIQISEIVNEKRTLSSEIWCSIIDTELDFRWVFRMAWISTERTNIVAIRFRALVIRIRGVFRFDYISFHEILIAVVYYDSHKRNLFLSDYPWKTVEMNVELQMKGTIF